MQALPEIKMEQAVPLWSAWELFVDFEDFVLEDTDYISDFLSNWSIKLKSLQELGLNYPDNILAFKLLKNCNVSEEAQSTVFAALQSQSDPLVEDMLLRTMNSLKNLLTSNFSKALKEKDKDLMVEFLEYSDDLDCEEPSSESLDEGSEKEHTLPDDDNLQTVDKQENDVRFKCEYCQALFFEKQDLMQHHEVSHQAERADDRYRTVPKVYMCTKCDFVYASWQELAKHLGTKCKATEVKNQLNVNRKKSKGLLGNDLSKEGIRSDLPSSEFVRYVCEYCQIQFDAKPDLKNHKKECHQTEKLKEGKALEDLYCKECDRQFKNKTAVYDHFNRHHKKKFMCAKCDHVFPSMYELKRHIGTHRRREEAEKRSLTENSNNQKISKDIGGSRVKCKECQEELKDTSAMIRHWKDVHNLGLSCTLCNLKFSEQSLLLEHEESVHKELTSTNQQTNEMNEFSCQPCDKKFASRLSFHDHIRIVHLKQYSCDECEKLYSSRRDLNIHLKVHQKREENVVQSYQCDQCGKQYETRRQLSWHDKKHFTFRCSECKRAFRTQEQLDLHIASHQTFTCDQCGKVFHKYEWLQEHMRLISHGAERCEECDICGKKFTTKRNLRRHKIRHEEEGKHPCTFTGCNKVCREKTKLIVHMRTHTGERPFQCDECEKSFTSETKRKEHKERHSGVRNHACDVCGKAFFTRDKLNVHNRIHTGEKPYSCDICGKSYTQSKDLTIHKKTHARI